MTRKRRHGDPPTAKVLLHRDVFAAYLEFKAEGNPAPTDKMSTGVFHRWMKERRPGIHARAKTELTEVWDALDYYCIVIGVPRA